MEEIKTDIKVEKCNHTAHKPPKAIHIPSGLVYEHICTKCGEKTIINAKKK